MIDPLPGQPEVRITELFSFTILNIKIVAYYLCIQMPLFFSSLRICEELLNLFRGPSFSQACRLQCGYHPGSPQSRIWGAAAFKPELEREVSLLRIHKVLIDEQCSF